MVRCIYRVKIAVLIIIIQFFTGLYAFAESTNPRVFRVTENPNFSHPVMVLERLVARKATTKRNTFCIIGYNYDDGTELAWVYWHEGKAIILWEPTVEGVADLASSKRYLRLHKDVVANEAALRGSTYLVTEQWVDALISACHEQGEYFKIFKN